MSTHAMTDHAPVVTRRQWENILIRCAGEKAVRTYHTRMLGPGDVVAVQRVEAQPVPVIERFVARITIVIDHGWYQLVQVKRRDNGQEEEVTLHSDGPPDWGVIEFRVLRKVHQPLPPNCNRI